MPKSRGRHKLAKLEMDALQQQREAFRAKFGRDPGPNDPIFFDPDAAEPTPVKADKMREELIAAMRQAGTPPQIIYAVRKTDLIVTEDTPLTPAQRREWDAAIDEYFELERKAASD